MQSSNPYLFLICWWFCFNDNCGFCFLCLFWRESTQLFLSKYRRCSSLPRWRSQLWLDVGALRGIRTKFNSKEHKPGYIGRTILIQNTRFEWIDNCGRISKESPLRLAMLEVVTVTLRTR